MLNQDALKQLKQLKRDIHDSIERLEGTVRGSRGRYGFLRTDDGREVFLPPEQMDKVLPGDRVRIAVVEPTPAKADTKGGKKADKKSSKNKDSGEIEKLIDSPIKEFTGSYVIRGKGHFVVPDVPGFSRYIFLPPSERKNLKPGDWLRAKISRHPIKDGRVQGRVVARIGNPSEPYIESQYAVNKYQLCEAWDDGVIPDDFDDEWATGREDLLKIPFVTIDSADTRDVDDALYAKENDDGWRLFVAIADPAAYIPAGSPLDEAARQRGSSVYMPGKVLPMLPEAISNERCSLLAEHDRPALVCRMQVSSQGEITDYTFISANVRSHAKLSYSEVNGHLHGERKLPEPSLVKLLKISKLLAKRRAEKHVAGQDYPDYRYFLDDKGKIDNIRAIKRNDAHRLVEECMIAANRCAADWLKDQQSLFVAHAGLRSEKLDNWKRLTKEYLPDLADTDLSTLEGHIALNRAIAASSLDLPLATILGRMQQRARLQSAAAPHHGLGFECYTTFTSPLRKYNDLLVHRALHAKIAGQSATTINDEQLSTLQQRLDDNRAAANEVTASLGCQYLEMHKDEEFDAVIAHVSGHGFKVRLLNEGFEGFVDSRDIEGKLKFDPDLLQLSGNAGSFQLDQAVKVRIKQINHAERSIHFSWVLPPEGAVPKAAIPEQDTGTNSGDAGLKNLSEAAGETATTETDVPIAGKTDEPSESEPTSTQ